MTGVTMRAGVVLVAGDRPARRRPAAATPSIRDGLQAVTGEDLLRVWEDAFGQVRRVVPVLAHTVDELDRHVQDRRTAHGLFTQASDQPERPEG